MRLLRSLRARVRAMDPWRFDGLLAALFLAEALAEVLVLSGADQQWPVGSLGVLVMAIGLSLRRRAPVLGMTLTMCGFPILQSLGPELTDRIFSPFFVMLASTYAVGAYAADRRIPLAVAIAFVLASTSTVVDGYDDSAFDYVFTGLVIIGGPMLVGRVIRNRSRLNRTLREKTERLRRERAEQAEQAAAEERTRIAGELHDVVAHALSAMVVQAGGARRLATKDPQRAADAFGAVETTGREALAEIRRLLGVLRRDDEEIALAPQPSLRHLSALVARTRADGLPVDLDVQGDARPLPAGVDLTAYRLVQAALAGAIEPGGAGSAAVTVRYRPDGLDLEVLDDGAASAQPRPLAGVRERVGLYGGQVKSGHRRGGGHAVRARLPVGGGA